MGRTITCTYDKYIIELDAVIDGMADNRNKLQKVIDRLRDRSQQDKEKEETRKIKRECK